MARIKQRFHKWLEHLTYRLYKHNVTTKIKRMILAKNSLGLVGYPFLAYIELELDAVFEDGGLQAVKPALTKWLEDLRAQATKTPAERAEEQLRKQIQEAAALYSVELSEVEFQAVYEKCVRDWASPEQIDLIVTDVYRAKHGMRRRRSTEDEIRYVYSMTRKENS